MKLLVGTTNPSKAKEIAELVGGAGIEVVTLKDVGLSSIEETGATFEENAVLKATTYARASGLPCVADDGGLEIDALGGAPGVYSHRWAGENATDLDLATKVIESLRGTPTAKRTARLRSVTAFAMPGGRVVTADRHIAGHIVESFDPQKLRPGFPYRCLLMIDAYGKLYADLTEEEHRAVNHRHAAFKELLPAIISALK